MIKKYFIAKDNTITNCYKSNLTERATGSNAGMSDTLQIFSIYGQASSSSQEKARTLLFLESDDISVDRTSGYIPVSGSVKFYLNLFNAVHPFTVPKNFILCVSAITSSVWDEGSSVDDDEWTEEESSNWNQASTSSGSPVYWDNSGSDYYTGSYLPATLNRPPTYTQSFDSGLENLRIDISSLMEEWMSTSVANYGMCVYLTSSNENATKSYYIKKFFGRGSEYFFYRPTVTAEWDDSIRDDRGFFYASSSLCNTENTNTVYLYNKVRGYYRTIPEASSSIYVQLYDDRVSGSLLNSTVITGGLVSTGIYSASIALNTTASIVYDRWFSAGLKECYATGSIEVNRLEAERDNEEIRYIVSMPNLKPKYERNEKGRLKVFVRDTNWSPTLYSVANNDAQFTPVKDMYYRISREIDSLIVVDYGTGSLNQTRLSYDVSGSYFDFDFSILEADYMYRLNYVFKRPDNLSYEAMRQSFKFRVEKEQY